jgi:hypothetical protein
MELFAILIIVLLVVLLFATIPAWPYSRDWGYNPAGIIAAVLAVVLVAWLFMAGLPGAGTNDTTNDRNGPDIEITVPDDDGDTGDGDPGNGDTDNGEDEDAESN